MKTMLIIGAGGHGKVVADTAIASGYDNIAFLDDAWPEKTSIGSWKVQGKPEKSDFPTFCAVGSNAAREGIFRAFELDDAPVLVHPSAITSPSSVVENGSLLVAGAIVNADARIGKGVILNTACSIDHDCVVGDFAHVSPGARLAGNVRIGKRSWIGIGAVVREGICIGDDVVIGAGSVVVEDIESGARVCGVPARKMT
ncbi:acetyltransferase [Gymnodinialimonas sp. 57CJ19]|uniref:acetyltransferase n=1 Tax=Gymnodinialimonas sp. 57CJ19 TaxID=3138498 RepID=UPI0031344E4F